MKRLFAALIAGLFFAGAWAAQVNIQGTPGPQTLWSYNTSVAVPQAGSTQLLLLNTGGVTRIFVQCTVASQALGGFVIKTQNYSNTTQSSLYSASGDYTTPTGILVGDSGDLTVLAAGATGWFIMDTTGLDQVLVFANSGNAAGSTVSCWAAGH